MVCDKMYPHIVCTWIKCLIRTCRSMHILIRFSDMHIRFCTLFLPQWQHTFNHTCLCFRRAWFWFDRRRCSISFLTVSFLGPVLKYLWNCHYKLKFLLAHCLYYVTKKQGCTCHFMIKPSLAAVATMRMHAEKYVIIVNFATNLWLWALWKRCVLFHFVYFAC